MKKLIILTILLSLFISGCSLFQKKYVCTYNKIENDIDINTKIILKYKGEDLIDKEGISTYTFKTNEKATEYYNLFKDNESYKIEQKDNKLIINLINKDEEINAEIKDAIKELESTGFTCK